MKCAATISNPTSALVSLISVDAESDPPTVSRTPSSAFLSSFDAVDRACSSQMASTSRRNASSMSSSSSRRNPHSRGAFDRGVLYPYPHGSPPPRCSSVLHETSASGRRGGGQGDGDCAERLQGRSGDGLEASRGWRGRGEAFSFRRDMSAAGEVFAWDGWCAGFPGVSFPL